MKWTDRLGRRVKLRDLHMLLAVAQAGSMAKAAEQLAVSYPVVSRGITDLEHTLGVRLFDRSIRGVEPTPYGRALLDCGAAVFDEMRQGINRIEFIKNPTSGDLRIGCSEPMAAGLLPAIAERFSNDYPGVVLHLLHSNVATLQYGDLRNRDVELLIGRLPTPFAEDDLAAETLFEEPMLVMAGAASPWAKRRRIELAQLLDEAWCLSPRGSLPRALQDEVFHASGLEVPRAHVITLSIQLYTIMIESGRWLGLVPGSVVRVGPPRPSLKVLPVEVEAPPRPVGIITVKNRTLNPLAERFIDCARGVAKKISISAPGTPARNDRQPHARKAPQNIKW
jgi:DNA-binding transcriptional LysR family regulator